MSQTKQARLNVVMMGNFPYPNGMAGTKRIQHVVDYLHANEVPVALLLLRQGEVNHVATPHGEHRGVPFFTAGHRLKPSLKGLLHLPGYLLQGRRFLKNYYHSECKNILYCYMGPTIENRFFLSWAGKLGYRIIFDIVEELEDLSEQRHLLARIKSRSRIKMDTELPRYASGLVVLSHHLKQRYRQSLGESFPMHLMPIAASVQNGALKERFGNPVQIVYSGSFAKKDGVENLIQAFINRRAELPNAELCLTGKGSRAEEIRRQVAGEAGIRFAGYLSDEDFYPFLRGADILCMTRIDSDYANAGFPFKLGEYLATGNPVIASIVGDVPKYLDADADALLIKANDVTAIEQALMFAVSNPQKALEIGRNGQQKCKKHFDPAVTAGELLAFMQNLPEKS